MTAAAAIVAALHVSNKIKDFGSYAGFAAVLGLAVLALLYFAQAREVKRLREWAGRAPERDAELQARVTADAQQRTAPAAAAVPAAAKPVTAAATPAGQAVSTKPPTPTPAPAAGPNAAPGAPATPATAPATSTPASQPVTAKPGVPAPATAAAAAAGAASASPAVPKPADGTPKPVDAAPKPAETAKPSVDGAAAASPPPAATPPAETAKPAGNGSTDQPTQITPPPPAASRPAPRPGQPLRAPAPLPPAADEHERSPLRTTLMIVGSVLAIAAIAVVLITTVFSSDSKKKTPNTIGGAPATSTQGSTSTGASGSPSKNTPVSRGDVTVAVLNGTTVPGLARGAATKLQTGGFKIGNVTNAPDQARSATLVTYQPGHQAEARVVARLIGVGADAVKPIDQSTQVVAGQEAFVVVTVGADQSR